jgi:hypothetical protein
MIHNREWFLKIQSSNRYTIGEPSRVTVRSPGVSSILLLEKRPDYPIDSILRILAEIGQEGSQARLGHGHVVVRQHLKPVAVHLHRDLLGFPEAAVADQPDRRFRQLVPQE